MDVSNVDPEEVLLDYQTIEPGDVSAEIDPADVNASEDKVMVSVRIRPSDAPSAWVSDGHTIKLDPSFARNPSLTNPSSTAQDFVFDSVLTGTPNKPIYTTVGRAHVHAAMEGFNAVVFAYGQTASGKTFTLTGGPTDPTTGIQEEPGIIPRSMRDILGFIKRTPQREYLLRCSYLEIYNETVVDLLAPPSTSGSNVVQIQGTTATDITLTPLREEVITSLKSVTDVLKRGEANRRTASTDWNERSSRSHSVFRVVIESRERSDDADRESGRRTPGGGSGRQTPGMSGRRTPGPKLQAIGGRSVQTSVLSLIDLAGSEKATSDKERTREGKYINTSLLTLGSVIGTLAENAAKNKHDHVPYRNSKLTRILQPCLAGNARISVICTINPDASAISESLSTLAFARRVKAVKLNAQKKEVVDTDALIERYRKEIDDLKTRLAERERDAPVKNRRLSAREQVDESKAMRDLNNRIQQLTKLILTSNTVDAAESRPASPMKVDFDMSPYQLQQELLAARHQLESQAAQILSLEQALTSRPPLPADAPEEEKDRLIMQMTKENRELNVVVKGYEDSLGEPLRAVREDVEREWQGKLDMEIQRRLDVERWSEELVRQLDRERKTRQALESQREALASFVSLFDSSKLGSSGVSKGGISGLPTLSRLSTGRRLSGVQEEGREEELWQMKDGEVKFVADTASRPASRGAPSRPASRAAREASPPPADASPVRIDASGKPSLFEEEWSMMSGDTSFDMEAELAKGEARKEETLKGKRILGDLRDALSGKENLPSKHGAA
ncbi:kinesin protein [Schizophyllum amplum]|uniref:Kinesin-like protein n=1 Tax=Schizophyllum amplum TaxID=97359 RepID=A0A550BRZ2_9AGAR|nr:kinesin protein [Auriculariopsis ampla]